MLKLTTVRIQESGDLRAVNAEKGISKDMFSSDRVLVADEVHEAVRAKMLEVLEPYITQMVDPENYSSDTSSVDFDHIRASLEQNIADFKIDAGSGFTATHKAALIGTVLDTINSETGEQNTIEAIDFVKPDNRDGAKTSTSSSAKTGTMSL